MRKHVLLFIVSEWLEEWEAPSVIPQQHPSIFIFRISCPQYPLLSESQTRS